MAVKLTNGLYIGPIKQGSQISGQLGVWTKDSNNPGVLNVSQLGLSMSAMARGLREHYYDADNNTYYYQRLYNNTEYAILYCIGSYYNGSSIEINYRYFSSSSSVTIANDTIQAISDNVSGAAAIAGTWKILKPGQYSDIYDSYIAEGDDYTDTSGVSIGFLYLGGVIAQATVV